MDLQSWILSELYIQSGTGIKFQLCYHFRTCLEIASVTHDQLYIRRYTSVYQPPFMVNIMPSVYILNLVNHRNETSFDITIVDENDNPPVFTSVEVIEGSESTKEVTCSRELSLKHYELI